MRLNGLCPRAQKYPPGTQSKKCTGCREVKLLDEFGVHKQGALGRDPQCKECRRIKSRSWTKKNREGKAARPRPDACEACHQPATARRALHWDHNHDTGQFRGWLCHGCNTAMGNLDDSIERLELLIQYLRAFR